MPADVDATRSALRKQCAAFENAEEQERADHVDEVIRLTDVLLEDDDQLPQRQQARARARAYERLRQTRAAVGAGIGVSALAVVLLITWMVRDAVTPARVIGAGLLAALVVGLVRLVAHDPVSWPAGTFFSAARYVVAVLTAVFIAFVLLLAAGVLGGWSGWIITVIAGLGAGLVTVGTLDAEGRLSS